MRGEGEGSDRRREATGYARKKGKGEGKMLIVGEQAFVDKRLSSLADMWRMKRWELLSCRAMWKDDIYFSILALPSCGLFPILLFYTVALQKGVAKGWG